MSEYLGRALTDLEICIAAMTEWPEEARPENLKYFGVGTRPHWYRESVLGSELERTNEEAIALFRDSGLGWLYEHENTEAVTFTIGQSSETHVQLELDHFQDPALRNRMKPGATKFNGPTLLSAIDQAIRSLK